MNRWPVPLEVRHQIAYSDAVAALSDPRNTYSAEASNLWREMLSSSFSFVEEFSAIEADAHTPFEQQLRLKAHALFESNPERKTPE